MIEYNVGADRRFQEASCHSATSYSSTSSSSHVNHKCHLAINKSAFMRACIGHFRQLMDLGWCLGLAYCYGL